VVVVVVVVMNSFAGVTYRRRRIQVTVRLGNGGLRHILQTGVVLVS
jgi:hypothetical protein